MAPGDLPRRLGVAAVGIPAVLGLLWFGGWLLAVPLAVLAALGAGEVYDLTEARGTARPLRWLGMIGSAAMVVGTAAHHSYVLSAPVLLGVVLIVHALALMIATFRRGPEGAPLLVVAVTLFGVFYVGGALAFIPLLHELPAHQGWPDAAARSWLGLVVVALPLACVWIGDSAAYFAGSAWGRNGPKLAPTISPNKSWVGSIAGLAGSAVAAVVWLMVAERVLPAVALPDPLFIAILGGLLGVGAQVGDLAESVFKREAGVKDSGTIFPGHGGVLDRIDALVLTLPLAWAALAWAAGTGP